MTMSGELSVFQRAPSRSPSPDEQGQDEEDEDWAIGLAFSSERHTDKIEGLEDCAQNWRLKDRVTHAFIKLPFPSKIKI
jgi:hypothetical protein